MKTITITLCLLFALAIGILNAQTLQAPANMTGFSDGANYSEIAVPTVSDISHAELPGTSLATGQLTMTATPNPFKDRTLVTCYFPAEGKYILEIRNMFGETVKTIEDNVTQQGDKSIEVSSERFRPGIYTAMVILKTSKNVMIKTIRIVYSQ